MKEKRPKLQTVPHSPASPILPTNTSEVTPVTESFIDVTADWLRKRETEGKQTALVVSLDADGNFSFGLFGQQPRAALALFALEMVSRKLYRTCE